MSTTKKRNEHHPHRGGLRGFGYFKRLGPGFVTGAADDDPAGIGTYSQIGAAFRFDLLWTACSRSRSPPPSRRPQLAWDSRPAAA